MQIYEKYNFFIIYIPDWEIEFDQQKKKKEIPHLVSTRLVINLNRASD